MSQVTVEKLAEKIRVPVDTLITQFEAVGVTCADGKDHLLTEAEIEKLLSKISADKAAKGNSGNSAGRLTITRRKREKLKLKSSEEDKEVTVVIKRKRVFKPAEPGPQVEPELEILREEEAVEEPIVESQETVSEVVEEKVVETSDDKAEALDEVSVSNQADSKEQVQDTASDNEDFLPKLDESDAPAPNAEAPAKDKDAAKKPSSKKKKSKRRDDDSNTWGDSSPSAKRSSGANKKEKRHQRHLRHKLSADAAAKHAFEKPTEPMTKDVLIPETIVVSELAQRMSVKAVEVIKTLMRMGVMATINQSIDQDTAVLVTEEMGHTPVPQSTQTIEETLMVEHDGERVSRAPIVTIMGHVDHGKTSLLDYIRRTKVAAGEAGGITQHIGAYHVDTPRGMVTFLDTPGHAAFSAMRARGASTTDICIVVVAADDGVKPQTIEAIQHAKAAGVPIIIAINKVDKEEADIDRAKNEVAQHDVIPEDWGGDTQFIPVSAKSGQGIDELLEGILLQAEVLELTAVEDCPASGVVVEASVDKGRGSVATILVKSGTLKMGDFLLCGNECGRVRAMMDEVGRSIKTAGPSIPVQILGLSGAPSAGDHALVIDDERKAKEVAEFRQNKEREQRIARQQASKLESFMGKMGQDGGVQQLNIVLKTDVQGSSEALAEALEKLSTDQIKVNLVGRGVGGLNASDIHLAMASNGVLVGFNVRADATARKLAQQEGLKLHYFSVIYDVIDTIKQSMVGLMEPQYEEKIVGLAEVRDVFRHPKMGAIAGCMVLEGAVKRNKPIRVLRDNIVIYEGVLESLRRFKDDVMEVKSGIECGIGVKNYNDIKNGDQIEVFESHRKEITL